MKTKIVDLNSLKIAKAETQTDLQAHELNLRVMAAEMKDSVFDFSILNGEESSSISDFLLQNFSSFSAIISGFFVNNIIRPKGKWAKKLTIAATTLLIKKYSAIFEEKIKDILR